MWQTHKQQTCEWWVESGTQQNTKNWTSNGNMESIFRRLRLTQSVACSTSCGSTPNWLTPSPACPPLWVSSYRTGEAVVADRPVGPDADGDGGRICGVDQRPTAATHVIGLRRRRHWATVVLRPEHVRTALLIIHHPYCIVNNNENTATYNDFFSICTMTLLPITISDIRLTFDTIITKLFFWNSNSTVTWKQTKSLALQQAFLNKNNNKNKFKKK